MEVYIGQDVSLARTAICVLGEKREIVTEAQVASAPESLVSFQLELPRGIAAIGLEAGPLSQWLHKRLTDAGRAILLLSTGSVYPQNILIWSERSPSCEMLSARSRFLVVGSLLSQNGVLLPESYRRDGSVCC